MGRHQQHRAAAAADVQQALVSFELKPIEGVGPDGELARAGEVVARLKYSNPLVSQWTDQTDTGKTLRSLP